MANIADLYEMVNRQGLALEAAVERLWPGADPAFWRGKLAGYDPAAKPKSKRRKPSRRGRSKRTFRADSVLPKLSISSKEKQDRRVGKATEEAVDRANGRRSILVSCGDQFKVVEV